MGVNDDGESNIIQFPSDAGEGVERGVRDPARMVARQLYLGLRPKAASPAAAVTQVLSVLAHHREALPAEAPPSDPMLIGAWSVQDDWEGRYRAATSIEIIDAPSSDARQYLADLQLQCARARENMLRLTDEMDGPPPDEHYGAWPTGGMIARWMTAQRLWRELSEAVARARDGVVRADRETTRDDYWEAEYQSTRRRLTEHYVGGGPQYELLVDRLSALDVRLRQMERSTRDIPHDEYKSLHDLHLKYVGQLQKHTETLKSESVAGIQEVAKRIMDILERHVKTAHPTTWLAIVDDVVQAVGDVA